MVELLDLIFRDAHQSLLSTRMRTEDMLPITEKMDQVGFWGLEVWGGATFDVPIRYLNQDPWDRINKLKASMPNTRMVMLERAMNIVAYSNFPDDIVRKFINLAHKNGVDVFRIFDALNDMRNMKVPIEAAIEAGAHAQGCISYTISPVHTVQSYIDKLLEFQRMGCQSVCIKDMAGMIFPQDAYDIISGYKAAGGKIPLDLHSHSTSGMEGFAYQRAIEAGADIVDSAISPISGGTAAPPAESIVQALRGTEWDTGYDIGLLMEIREYFQEVWKKYRHLHRINNLKADPSVTVHQIPGGMLSNLVSQLEQQGAADRYDDVLKETPKVRAEMGYPPLVTPTSQVVGVQAVMNVLFGRYKVIPEETKQYVRGFYGRPPAEISPKIKELVLGKDWEDQMVDCRPADLLEPKFDYYRDLLDEKDLWNGREEDVLTFAIYPEVGLKFLKGEAVAEFTSDQLPLPKDHEMMRNMVKSIFPEHEEIYIETLPPEERTGGVASIPTEFEVDVNGEPFEVKVVPTGGFVVSQGGAGGAGAGKPKEVEGAIHAHMQGNLWKITVAEGDEIGKGDVVAILEVMKMEQNIEATHSGTVKKIFAKEGDAVKKNELIMQVL